MGSRAGWLLAACAIACADGANDESHETDPPPPGDRPPGVASPDEGSLATSDFVASAAPPRLSGIVATPPDPGPCPAGWTSVPLETGHYCDVPATPACATGEIVDLLGTCRAFGAACPDDGWPADLSPTGPKVYVDPAALSGGDGQRGSPFRSLLEALAVATQNAEIALRTGEHESPRVRIDRNITVVGACASGTRLRIAGAGEAPAALTIMDGGLRHLTLTSPHPAINVGALDGSRSGRARLDTVAIEDVGGIGAAVGPGSELVAQRLWMHDVRVLPSEGQTAVFLVTSGGRIRVRDSVLEGGAFVGTLALGGGEIDLESTAIRRVRAVGTTYGYGSASDSGGTTVLREVLIEDTDGVGAWVDDGVLDAEHLVVRHVAAVADHGVRVGAGLLLEDGGAIRLRGGAIRAVGPKAVVVKSPGSNLTLSDVWIGDVDGLGDPQEAILAGSGSKTSVERLWIANPRGMVLIGAGTSGSVRDLIVRAPSGPTARNAAGLAVALGATVTATAVDIATTTAVEAFDVQTRLRVQGLRAQLTSSVAFAAAAASNASLEVYDAEIDAASAAGFAIFDAKFDGEDIVVRRPDVGFSTAGATLRLARVRVDDAIDMGLTLDEGAQATIEDLVVDGLSSRTTNVGVLNLDGSSTATVSRGHFSRVSGPGVVLVNGATATLRDVRVRANPVDLGLASLGLYADGDPRTAVDVARMAVDGFRENVVIDGRAQIRDLRSTGETTAYGFRGRGKVKVVRARITDLNGVGLQLFGDARFEVEDLVVDTIEPDAAGLATGVTVSDDAELVAARVRIRAVRMFGVLATQRAQLTLRDVQIVDARLPECPLQACGVENIAAGLFLQQTARVDVERFDIRRSLTAGILLRGDASFDVRAGTIAECAIGLLLTRSSLDGAAVFNDVSFESNERDVLTQAEDYPSIEPARPDPPAVDPAEEKDPRGR